MCEILYKIYFSNIFIELAFLMERYNYFIILLHR